MRTNLYSMTVPLFKKNLKTLGQILDKAYEHANKDDVEMARLMHERLYEDMLPLGKQIEIATDTAKGASSRLSGIEAPTFEDGDFSLPHLHERIKDTIAYLDTVTEESFADAEERKITLKYYPGKQMDGFGYVTEYALPNFFFHMTTAYGILRKEGIPLGKADYLGGLPLTDEAA